MKFEEESKPDPVVTITTHGWISNNKRYFHNYKKEYGGTQKDMIDTYLRLGKEINEIQELLRCPRASIRGRMSELRNKY